MESKTFALMLQYWWWLLFPKYYIVNDQHGGKLYVSLIVNNKHYLWEHEKHFAYKFKKRQAKRFIKQGKAMDGFLQSCKIEKVC